VKIIKPEQTSPHYFDDPKRSGWQLIPVL